MVKWLNDTGLEELLSQPGVVAVAFLDESEKSSRAFLEQFKAVEQEFYGIIKCFAISAIDNPPVKLEHRIYCIPTTTLFRDGNELAKFEVPYPSKMLCEKMIAAIKEKR